MRGSMHAPFRRISLPTRDASKQLLLAFLLLTWPAVGLAQSPPRIDVAGQPLAANVRRVLDALELLGRPLDPELTKRLNAAVTAENAGRLQELLDPHVLSIVTV